MKRDESDKRKFFMPLTIVGIVILLAIEALIDLQSNLNSADATAQVLLEEIKTVFDRNEEEEATLTESLKEDYITRAEAVAYIIQNDEDNDVTSAKLNEIADLMNVDEISIFNPEGVIVESSVPDYVGYSMESGEQLAFFKPMLTDQTLTLCQDVTPNTALGKSMMYAATWQEDGSEIVQVGISPSHLLQELNLHEITEVVDSMPMTDGVSIYVAQAEDGVILGATNHDDIGRTLDDIGISKSEENLKRAKTIRADGKLYRVSFAAYGDYAIGILYDFRALNQGMLLNLGIVFLYLCLFAGLIYLILTVLVRNRRSAKEKLEESNRERDAQLEVLASMSKMYLSMHLIDLEHKCITEYGATDAVRANYQQEGNKVVGDMAEVMRKTMIARSSDYSREDILEFTDLNTIRERMKGVKSVYRDFISVRNLWSRACFITIKQDAEGYPLSLIYAVQVVDEEKRREEALLVKSNTDGLTRCYNRSAYEEDVAKLEEEGIPEDLVLISMDVNGLKVTNDSMGHVAGDELLMGAVECIRKAFGSYGKIYRTGGDEFMLLLRLDEKTCAEAFKYFDSLTRGWSGKLVKELSVSSGYVFCREMKDLPLFDIEKIADQKMYKAKSLYYANKGIDRRGRSAAYTALCDSYTKILRVNLTEDSFQTIKMDAEEKSAKLGYAEKISLWLKTFATSGQVASSDLDEYLSKTDLNYLRRYFASGEKYYRIFYHRKYGQTYRKVLMEMTPAENYAEDNQIVYLYVKNLE